jgi:hypothetical protein
MHSSDESVASSGRDRYAAAAILSAFPVLAARHLFGGGTLNYGEWIGRTNFFRLAGQLTHSWDSGTGFGQATFGFMKSSSALFLALAFGALRGPLLPVTLLAAPSLAGYWLLRRLPGGSALTPVPAALVASILTWNPVVSGRGIAGHLTYLLALMLLTIFVTIVWRVLDGQETPVTRAQAVGMAIVTGASFQIAAFIGPIMVLAALVLVVLYARAITLSRVKDLALLGAAALVGCVALNAHSLLPAMVAGGEHSTESSTFTLTSLLSTSATATTRNALLFVPDLGHSVITRSASSGASLGLAVLPILATVAFVMRRGRVATAGFAMWFIGTFLAKGPHPPAGVVFIALFNHVPTGSSFRDPTKFMLLSLFGVMVAIGALIRGLRAATVVVPLAGLMVLIAVCDPALRSGDFFGSAVSARAPSAYASIDAYLEKQRGNARLLFLPTAIGLTLNDFAWYPMSSNPGYASPVPYLFIPSRPVAASLFSSPASKKVFAEAVGERGDVRADLLARVGVRWVMLDENLRAASRFRPFVDRLRTSLDHGRFSLALRSRGVALYKNELAGDWTSATTDTAVVAAGLERRAPLFPIGMPQLPVFSLDHLDCAGLIANMAHLLVVNSDIEEIPPACGAGQELRLAPDPELRAFADAVGHTTIGQPGDGEIFARVARGPGRGTIETSDPEGRHSIVLETATADGWRWERLGTAPTRIEQVSPGARLNQLRAIPPASVEALSSAFRDRKIAQFSDEMELAGGLRTHMAVGAREYNRRGPTFSIEQDFRTTDWQQSQPVVAGFAWQPSVGLATAQESTGAAYLQYRVSSAQPFASLAIRLETSFVGDDRPLTISAGTTLSKLSLLRRVTADLHPLVIDATEIAAGATEVFVRVDIDDKSSRGASIQQIAFDGATDALLSLGNTADDSREMHIALSGRGSAVLRFVPSTGGQKPGASHAVISGQDAYAPVPISGAMVSLENASERHIDGLLVGPILRPELVPIEQDELSAAMIQIQPRRAIVMMSAFDARWKTTPRLTSAAAMDIGQLSLYSGAQPVQLRLRYTPEQYYRVGVLVSGASLGLGVFWAAAFSLRTRRRSR